MKSPVNESINFEHTSTNVFTNSFVYENLGIKHSVFSAGNGPGVLLMHELPGMTEEFWRLANWLSEHFTVWAPDLFGNNSSPTNPNHQKLLLRACISREIFLFARNDSGPITQWLRSLSKQLHASAEGAGIGVIGMCMSGNFALTLALDPWVLAPVASQPALPASMPLRKMDTELQLTKNHCRILKDRDVDIMALRFKGDKLCNAQRFDAIRNLIGKKRFYEHVIDDEHRNPRGPLSFPHAVLTADLVDEDISVTKTKLKEVIKFLKDRIYLDC